MPTPRKNITSERQADRVFPHGDIMNGHEGSPEDPPQVSVQDQITAFEESGFGRLLGMHITEARDGYARVEMDCTEKCNPHGVAHGGAVFSLADHAFGIASNCGQDHHTAVSVHIQYLAPARGRLVAVAERVASNGTCGTYRVVVYEGERTIAVFDGVAFRV